MRNISLAALSALLVVSVPAAARTNGQSSSAGTAATTEKPGKADQKVCKFVTSVGTRLEKKMCKTDAEWKKYEAHN